MAASIWFNCPGNWGIVAGMKNRDVPILDRRSVPRGQRLITEGELGTQAYLIQSGEMSVYVVKDGVEVELARLQAGQIVGEMALVFDAPRTANVRATVDSNVIVISRVQFEDKLADSDPTIRAIVSMLSRRIMESNKTLLNRKNDLRDLKDTVRTIYQNIRETLPHNQKGVLENMVLPHLKSLMDAIDAFRERYETDHPTL